MKLGASLSITPNNYSKRIRRGIIRALEAAMASVGSEFQVGSVLIKKGNLIGKGCNSTRKSCPDSTSRGFGIHAEMHCLRRSAKLGEKKNSYDLIKLAGAELFVARLTPGNRIALAKPCIHCQGFLKHLGLKRIYYTNETGGISDMTLKND